MTTFDRQEHDLPFPNSGEVGSARTPGRAAAGATAGQAATGATPDQAAAGASGPGPVGAVPLLAYLDVVVLVLAAPILLLIGVPAAGYAIGAGGWIVLRAVGVLVEREASRRDARTQISVRLGYMLGRLFLLAIAVIVARQSGGKDDGLTALAVIVFAFTIQLGISAVNRPKSR